MSTNKMGDNSSNIAPLFWLPSDFLDDDDDILMGQEHPALTSNNQLPTEFPYDFTELTRHFASANKWGLSASPQSILSPVLSNGSPNSPSSPTAPFSRKTDQSWNLICAAAGEVSMWKIKNQTANKSRALPTPLNIFTPLLPSNKITPVKQKNDSVWGHPFGVSAEYGCGFSGNARCGRAQRPFQIGWPTSQVQNQHFNVNMSVSHPSLLFSGGRSNSAGGGVGLKRKCAGTGVFLPRTCPGPADSTVKPGCPHAFTPPTRPANNVMTLANAQPSFRGGVTSDHDAMLMRRNAVLAQQRRNGINVVGNGAANCELFLPLEWSY